MTVDLEKVVKAKAEGLGISKKAAVLVLRSVDHLIDEIVEDSQFSMLEDYTKEEFSDKFSDIKFILPTLGQIKLDYKLYKGKQRYYVKSRKDNSCI